MMQTKLTLYQQHALKYKKGCGSPHCDAANKIVLCRGKLPCDVLFCGEAAGESEDSIGAPFVGPAGHLLDSIVSSAIPTEVRVAFTNLVGCIPREINEETGLPHRHGKATEPDGEQIEACSTRLIEFVELCKPKLIVCVGKHAADHLDVGYRHSIPVDKAIPRLKILHPAYLLRAPMAQRDFLTRRCIIQIRDAVTLHVLGET